MYTLLYMHIHMYLWILNFCIYVAGYMYMKEFDKVVDIYSYLSKSVLEI